MDLSNANLTQASQAERWIKKNQNYTIFLCLYYLYTHQFWRELWRNKWYLLLLKCFWWKSGSQKVWLTAGISTLTPPIMKNTSLQFSGWIRPFWSSLYLFLKQFFFGWISNPGWPQPASPDGLIQPFLFFLKPSLTHFLFTLLICVFESLRFNPILGAGGSGPQKRNPPKLILKELQVQKPS